MAKPLNPLEDYKKLIAGLSEPLDHFASCPQCYTYISTKKLEYKCKNCGYVFDVVARCGTCSKSMMM